MKTPRGENRIKALVHVDAVTLNEHGPAYFRVLVPAWDRHRAAYLSTSEVPEGWGGLVPGDEFVASVDIYAVAGDKLGFKDFEKIPSGPYESIC